MTPLTPPKSLEAIVALFIPPACREPVLGDLHERYTSPHQYLADALRTVPHVVLSQIRRTTGLQLLVIEAFAVLMAFLGAVWITGGSPLHNDPRLFLPALATVFTFVLAEAYTHPGKRGLPRSFTNAVLAGAVGALVYPVRITVVACTVSVIFLFLLRAVFPPQSARLRTAAGPDIHGRSAMLQQQVRRGNLGLILVALTLVPFGWIVVSGRPATGHAAGSLIFAAALYILYQIHRRGLARFTGDYRTQLERRRNALRSIWSWYLLPFLGAMTVFVLWTLLAYPGLLARWPNLVPFPAILTVWSVAMLKISAREAHKLQEEIDSL